MQSMERPKQVNKLSPNDRQSKKKGTKGKKPAKERKCYRCGGTGHLPLDKSCPALDKTCNKCGKSGHFAACCKTKSIKKPSGRDQKELIKPQKRKKKKITTLLCWIRRVVMARVVLLICLLEVCS